MKVGRWFRRLRDNKPLALLQAVGLVTVGVLAFLPSPANAYEFPTGSFALTQTGATDISSATYPSGVTTTVTATGATDLQTPTTLGARGWDQTHYTPTNMQSGDTGANVVVNTGSCNSTGSCPGLGTLTVTFSEPVRNPVIHMAGMGGATATTQSGTVVQQSDLHAIYTLTTPGVTLSKLDGNAQLAVTSNVITAVNDSTSPSCTTNVLGGTYGNAAGTASCGSIQVNGTVTTLTFNMSAVFVQNSPSRPPVNTASSGDGMVLTFTLPQDFSDAPASYNGSQAPAHTLSNLTLGASVDEDRPNDRNATTSPFAGAAANGDDTSGTDDEDAFGTLPLYLTNQTSYSLTVPLSGVSKAATLCGWIDVNKNGTFDTGERACATPAAGATSATLTWSGLSGVTPGTSYARLRLGYTAGQVQSPTGLAGSGEVEDYPITFADPPRLRIAKVSNGGTDTFPFAVSGATIGSDSVTTTAAGSTVTSTTVHLGTAGTPVTVSETVPAGWRATSATCNDANAATTGVTNPVNGALTGFPVAGGGTASVTIPGGNVRNNADVTCTFTNEKLARLTIVKTTLGGGSSFDFTTTGAGLSNFSLNPSGGGQQSASTTFADLAPGQSYSITEVASGGNNSQFSLVSAACVNNTGGPTGSGFSSSILNNATTFGSVTVNPLVAGADVICTFMNVRDPRLVIVKQSQGGDGTFNFTATTTAGNLDSNAPSITTSSGTGVFNNRITGLNGNSATTLTLNETSPAAPFVFSSVSCVNASGTTVGSVSGSQVTLSGVTTGTEITCTYVNKVRPTIKIRKSSSGGTGTFSFSSSIFPSSPVAITTAAQNTPTPPAGDPTYTVNPDQQVTITEAVPANWSLSGVSCVNTNSNSVVPSSFTSGGQLTIPATSLPGGANLVCTFTDTRNARTLTVTKALVPATDAGQFQMNANGSLSIVGGNGVTASATALAGAAATFAETAGSGTSLANYTSAYRCVRSDTGAVVASGPGTSGGFTMPDASVDCTITNTRLQSQLRLAKTWSGAEVGDTAVLSATGPQTIPVFTSTADSPAETDTGPASTVYAGQSYALSEDLGGANLGSYSSSAWSCTGGSLSGSTLTITGGAAGSTITCTIVNTLQPVSISLDKTASPTTFSAPGQTITYSYLVTNTGGAPVFAPYTVADDKASVTCPETPAALAPGDSVTCTATYVTSQADVDAGSVTNVATAAATDQAGRGVTSNRDTVTVTADRTAALTVDKQAGVPTGSAVGDTIDYTFLVENTGNVTLTNVNVDDPKVGSVSCPQNTLAPGEQMTCTGTYTLTQDDIDAGTVDNTVTVTATPPGGVTPPTATDSTSTPITRTASLTLDKQSAGVTDLDGNGTDAGDELAYTFLVTNTGNTTLTGVTVTDPLVGPVTCPTTPIGPGESVTCTATYVLTQGDIDAGEVVNTADATATPPPGVTPPTATDTLTTPVAAAASLSLDKQDGVPSGSNAGDTIAYDFVVTNTGSVTLDPLVVDDPLVGPVSCPVTSLTPGESTTCTATYTLIQADVDAGSVTNTATATGTAPNGDTPEATDSVTTPLTQTPGIAIDKQAGTPTGSTVGDTIDYTFLVTNTGNVTLANVGVSDATVGTVSCPVTTLAPTESVTCTAQYTLTQTDIDAGHVANTADATGTPPGGLTPPTATDSTDVPLTASPAVTLDKQAGVPSGNSAGDTVDYSFVVTNTGNVTLTGISVDDPLVGTVNCPTTTLAPTESTTCTATYTLTQTDVDSGHVANTATVTGTDPNDTDVDATDSTDTPIAAGPAISLDKQAGVPTGNSAGDTVDYTFLVTNTGNVTLTGIVVDDPLVGTVDCPTTTLAPTESTTCTATYTLTQADVDAGVVDNSATVTGTDPNGTDVDATDTASVPITAAPAVTLDKQAGTPSGNNAGDTIDYTFVVTNTGNVTLTGITVDDPLVGTVDCPTTTLAPTASTTCTATYTLTQTDVDSGHVANTATVTGTDPNDTDVDATDSTDTPIAAGPAISLDKQAGTPSGNSAGDTVDYSFVVTNTGNVTLTGISVDDPLVGTVDCPTTTLAPTESTTCTATYTLTQADVDAGVVDNTATVTGTDPNGTDVDATDTASVPITAAPAVTLDKQAGTPSGNNAGDTIDYTFVVTNTGNVTLTGITVDDPLVGTVDCPTTTLAPTESTTCTATYTLTQTDVDSGHVANTATVTGTDPNDTDVDATDSTDTPIAAGPAISLDKQAGVPSGNSAGDTVDYSFVVTNTGNVTLTGIVVDDPLVGTVDCPTTTLAPTESTTCTATYTLTQADVDAGVVDNTATVTGTDPNGTDVDATDTASVPITAAPAVTLDKQAGTPSGNSAGDTIDYSFVVTNTGNVTLDPVSVDDPTVGPVTCDVTVLAPTAVATCTATYALTQADVDAGHIANTATATGTDPNGTDVDATDNTDVPIAPGPAVTLDKQAGVPTGNSAGDTVDYSFVVTNTGNVTLTGIAVDDPLVGTVDCPTTTLAPTESTTCTATYTLTQADVDAGVVDNTATVTGTDPNGTDVDATDTASVPITAAPAVTLDKQAGVPTGNSAGDTVDYTFLVTNTGNVTLTGISVDDPLVGTVDCPTTTLAPTESTTCTATYTLTQADVDAGVVDNTATVTGTDPNGTDVDATDTASVPITAAPAVTLDKQAGTPSGNNAGDTIDYTFVVTNTGNVTLTGITVDDPLVGTVDCPTTTLAPTASTTCTATYTLTQTDVDSGHVANTATVTGTDPNDTDVDATDSTDTPIAAGPAITLDKQAGVPSGNSAGDTVDYTFLVTNTGNVTLTGIVVDDPLVGTVDCPTTTLAPTESTTCTATYTLTQADVDAGVVDNTATVTGTDPNGTDVDATDTASVPITAAPAVTLDKQAGVPSGNSAGDTIDYTFVVTNTGNVTLTGISVDDPLVGTVDCPTTTLAPTESTTCTATYTLTQTDVDSGHVANTATVTGTDPNDTDVDATDSTDTPIAAGPAITLDKQAGVPSGNSAGDTVDYSFVVTNTGNVTLTGIVVDDPLVGTVDCPTTTLAPTESTTCTATYTLTQADVDAGVVDNTATVTGTDPNGTDVDATDTASVPITAAPAVTLDKQAGTPSGNSAGDTIDYSFVVTNTGNVTLDPVSVDDPTVGPVTCDVTVLAPTAVATCTATYALTQADVDAGHIANTATATGTDPNGTDVDATDNTDVPIAPGPAVTLDKQAGVPTGNSAGDTVDYSFVVTNTGNVTLTGIAVDDPLVGTVDCPTTTLAPTESTTCTATYTLTQADVDAGVVDNTATVTGTDPNGTDVDATDTASVPITAAPAVTLDKQAGVPTGNSAGDTVDYSFVVTNTGNVTLTGISVDDPLVGTVDCPTTTLAPTESTTCTATYTLTQADVDAGVVDNSATVTGTDPNGTDVDATDTASVPITAAPAVTLDKQAGTPSGNNAGDTIDYTFVVTNTGNVTLTGITVDDPLVGTVDCPTTTLAPTASTTCTATYTLTQTDVDSGHVANTATVTGTDPNDTDVDATDSTDTPIAAGPAITLDKQAGVPSGNSAGDTVDYTFLVTNTGNVTLTGIVVDDPLVGTVDCPTTTLAPTESTTCTATYTLTQADVDAGVVDNTATVTGTDPNGTDVDATDTASVPITAAPAVTLDKQAGVPSGNSAGDTIDYTFVVTNTGNVTLTGISVDDPLVGTVDCPTTTLAPTESTTCTATYTLTQTDVDSGHVANTATVTGTDPNDTDVDATDSTDTPIAAGPAITLDKQAGVPTGNSAGDTVDYTFLVTNTGNVTLTGIVVDDPLVGTVDCPTTTLAPTESTTCTATYTLTQADVDAGVVDNTATVTGTDPNGTDVDATDTASVPITAAPAVTLDKQAGTPSGNNAGDTIDYTFVVTNTGNVTLTGITVDDPLVGTVDCPTTTLAPTESTTCTATYTLTQTDVDSGHVANTATVTGTDPNDTDVDATDSTDTPIAAGPAITLDKQAGTPSGNSAGDTVDYTFLVTNTGNVTLTGISVDDPLVGTVDCPTTTLAPTESTTCTATYTLTQADVDAGVVDNTATVTGTDPNGTDVDATDTASVPITAAPAVTLDKQAGTPSGNNAGDTIDYTFVVTNTGNVTLTGITVDDPLVGTVDCPTTTLAPTESTTCTATYTLTQADVDAGVVDNSATVTGTDPNDTDVTDVDTASVDIPAEPAIALDKQAGIPTGTFAGDTIDYTFVVTNTGNVTLTGIDVADPLVGTVDCPTTTLAPTESTTCTATYTLTQADVDSGHVANTATVTGTDPNGTDVDATDSTDTPIPAGPAITLDKEAGVPSGNFVGDAIEYTFLVANTGNVTLTDIVVDDPLVGTVDCPTTTLLPGEQTTCTATYTLTQDDVDAGVVDNTATVTGTDPNDTDVTSTDSTSTPIEQTPAIDLVKEATAVGDEAGETIDYIFTVTNTGNVTLTGITVDDPLVGAVDCLVTTLAPTESVTCTATYTLTQADVDAGQVENTATASGLPPATPVNPEPEPVTDVDTVVTPIDQNPSIELVKSADTAGPVSVGDEIVFSFEVTNTGNVTLTKVKVKDPMVGPVTCPQTTLAPGEAMTCTAEPYTVTAQDVRNGEVVNRATATGTGGGGVEVSAQDEVVIETRTSGSGGGGGLPNTGNPVDPIVPWIALGMLGAGGALIVGGRRRKEQNA